MQSVEFSESNSFFKYFNEISKIPRGSGAIWKKSVIIVLRLPKAIR